MGLLSSMFAGEWSVSNEDHWLAQSGGGRWSVSGTQVSEQRAMKVTAAYAAIGILADGCAQLPIDVVQTSNGRTDKQDHVASRLLNDEPNPFMTPFTARQTVHAHQVGWGNGIFEIQRTEGGDPIALWPLLPDRTWIEKRDNTVKYMTLVDGHPVAMNAQDVLHLPALAFDGLWALSPIAHYAREAVGLALATEEFGGRFFGNDMKSGGFLTHPGKLSTEAQKRIVEAFEEEAGLSHAHRMKILEEGMTYQNTTIPPEEAQFLKTREFQVEEIARLYRIPLFMMQSHAKDTSWGSGISEQTLGMLKYTLSPWLIRSEQEYARKLLTRAERERGISIKHNVTAFLRPDAKGRSEYYAKALDPTKGWMNRDEVRELEDLNPDERPQIVAPEPG